MVAAMIRRSTRRGSLAADGPDLARLERAKEHRLQRRRRLADLVEEERPAVGQLEEAAARGLRAREGALHVPEELARHELRRQRGEVLRDEAAALARAALVDGGGDELLADAGLAVEQHVGVGAGRRR